MKRNFGLDVLLFLSGLICIGTGICLDFHLLAISDYEFLHKLRDIHIYSGYVMAVGIIFHIAWHAGWIKSVTKQLFFKD
jgi:hypothetical protein